MTFDSLSVYNIEVQIASRLKLVILTRKEHSCLCILLGEILFADWWLLDVACVATAKGCSS